jgi:glycosyltransferase involved in cell wall biosynthesis
MVEVSVIIPSLNEAKTIGTCIQKIKTVFTEHGIDGEIIVVDSSQDDTPQIASALGARVVTPDKSGYGYAYLYGFEHAEGKFVVVGDGDNTYDFLELPRFLGPLVNGEADMVIGSRFKGEIKKGAMPWAHRHLGNPALTKVLNWYFKASISDAHCGFRAIRKDALERMRLRSHGMEFASEMVMEAVRRKLRIIEVPVTYYPRDSGTSKLNSFSDGWRHLKLMLIFAPTYLYLVPGLIFDIFGVLLMSSSYFNIIVITYSPGIHSMMLGSLLVIIGYQVIFLGVFAKIYGVKIGMFDPDRTTEFVSKNISLEKGAIIGLMIFLVGLVYSTYLVMTWITEGYVSLPLRGEDMIAFTLLVVGLQTFFNSFFLSMIGNI